jgi:cell division protein FtsB
MRTELRRLPLPPTDILTILVSTAAVFFTLAFGGKALEGYRLRRHNAILEAEIAVRQEQQQELQKQLDYAQTPAYVERVAREQYRWVKAGETLVITIFQHRSAADQTPAPPTGSAVGTSGPQPVSHWLDWWNLLVGKVTSP